MYPHMLLVVFVCQPQNLPVQRNGILLKLYDKNFT